MKVMVGCIVLATVLAMTASTRASDRPEPATPEELGRLVIASLSAQDTNAMAALCISLDEFKATFAGANREGMYTQLMSRFVAAIPDAMAALANAEFMSMDMRFVPEAHRTTGVPTQPGMDSGGITFKGETFTLDNVWVKVRVADKVRKVKLDAMVKVGKAWRLISGPVVKPEQPGK